MKLCVACLARTDMTPRPSEVVTAPSSSARPRLDSMFDAEEEIPTTLYTPHRAPRGRARAATGAVAAG